jgi:tetratricopeptide (TPR) repeat protein
MIGLTVSSVFAQNPSIIGPSEDGPLECAFSLVQNSNNKILNMMKIAFVYTNAKEYKKSLYITGIIGNEVFTEFYILPAIVWGYGQDQNYSQAQLLVDGVKNPQAKLVAMTWLAKAYIAHHRDVAKLVEEGERMIPALVEQWRRTRYTTENYIDFLKRVDTLVNFSETEVQSGRKSNAKKIVHLTLPFIRSASMEVNLLFLKGAALLEVALSQYQSGYKSDGITLMDEAAKYMMADKNPNGNGSILVELAAGYAKIGKFDKALRIAGLLRNDTSNYDRAACLEKIGAEYDRTGRKKEAEAIWKQILGEITDSDVPGKILWLANVGIDFYETGRKIEANEFLGRSLELANREKELALSDTYPEALIMIAGKYREIGALDTALGLVDETYNIFIDLYLNHKLDPSPNQGLTPILQEISNNPQRFREFGKRYFKPSTIEDFPVQVRTDLLGINIAMEYAQLGVPLRALQMIRRITFLENKVEALLWVGKIFYDNKIQVSDEMRKILREIAGGGTQEKG